MGSGGGGNSTTTPQNSPQVEALQKAAMPQIQEMMRLNPLSNYAAWAPRQIAGSNPAYENLFNQASRVGPALQGLELIFGNGGTSPASPMAVPNMSAGGGSGSMGGMTSGTPAPPPQFAAPNIQDMIAQQIQQQVASAVQPPGPELLSPNQYRTAEGNVINGQVSYGENGQQIFVPTNPAETWTPWIPYYPV